MQLVAYGAQDIYLTGNAQITYWKVVYRRYTNFAMESIEQTFNGTADFGKRVTATISRNGDLIQQMYLEVTLTNSTGSNWTYGVGNALIQYVEIEIGGQMIDKHYGEWLNIWTELSMPEGKRVGYDDMVGNVLAGPAATTAGTRFYVPLQFWFNRNPGLALPLIALQYHEVKLNIQFNPATYLVATGTPTANIKLYVNYIFLDTDERRRFAQVSHEYLVEQVQFTGAESIPSSASGGSKNVVLNLNHPCKELIWVHRSATLPATPDNSGDNGNSRNAYFNWTLFNNANGRELGLDTFYQAKLQLNGHDRFSTRYADYFRKVQNYEHHTRVPRVDGTLLESARSQYIYVYSFAISPEEFQPSGTCNFSRIDNAILQLTYPTIASTTYAAMNLYLYAVNYNVLRIMSGMGGLGYSN